MTAFYSDLFQPRQKGLRVLVACEYSGIVRNAFLERGHDAWSCDLLPSEDGSNRHIRGDARAILNDGWDLLMVAHPPCTRLCNSGVRWLSKPPPGRTLNDMHRELREGADLFSVFWNAAIDRICVENPVMHKHAKALIVNYREFSQSVQPWQFGHGRRNAHASGSRTCRRCSRPMSSPDASSAFSKYRPDRSDGKSVHVSTPVSQKPWPNNGVETVYRFFCNDPLRKL